MLKHLLTRPVRVLAVAAAAILAVGLTSRAATAAPATNTTPTNHAATAVTSEPTVTPMANFHGCPLGSVCFWADINFHDNVEGPGAFGHFSGDNLNWGNFRHRGCTDADTGGTWNDCASSIINHGEHCAVHLFARVGLVTPKLTLQLGDSFANLGNHGWNDRISSNSWC